MKFRPFDLRIDHGRWNGLAFTENPRPVVSWAVQTTGNDQYQSACHIRVIQAGKTVWDSGWVDQKEQSLTYNGVALESSTEYTLTLTVRNNQGATSEPVQKSFMTALLTPWPAPWLKPAEDYEDGAIYAWKTFSLKEVPETAVGYACGLGYHQLWINGQLVAPEDYMTPAYSSYHKRCYYTAHADLEKWLQVGENTIGMVVAPGWRRNRGEYLENTGGRPVEFMGEPQFTAILALSFTDGRKYSVMTDESWRSCRGPVVKTNIFDGETYDAGKKIPYWCTPEMPQTGIACQVTGAPAADTAMELQKLEPVRVGRIYSPHSVSQPQLGVFIFDFGQNLAGVCQLKIPADLSEGTKITIRHAELLDENGMLYTAPLRTAAATDCYIAGKPDGKDRLWKPEFTYHGFRYAEVTGLDRVPEHDFIRALALHNDVENSSTFRCGNGMVNRLHKAIVATELANIHNVPTDCPQRDERMFWLNDANVRFEEMAFNVETGRLFPKIVRDIIDSQSEDGAIPCTVPFIYGTQPTDPVCSSFLVAAKQAWLHDGNVELIRQAYPALCAWNECIYRMAENGIIANTLYGDWASPEDCCMEIAPFSAVTPGSVLSTGYCYYNALLLAQFAKLLDLREEESKHLQRAQLIRHAMLEKWLQEDGTFASGSQACQAFALWLGMIPEDRCALVAEKLHEAVETAGYRLTTGNLCTLYMLNALAEYGYIEDAWKLLTREEYPSWGYMLQNDATTIWERFELKKDPGMNSHSHPMYGAVGAWLYTHLVGIQPLDTGFSKVRIQPHIPKNLTFAEAVLDTCKGQFRVKWQKQYGKLTLLITIPFGVEAQIYMREAVRTVGSGTYVFETAGEESA